MMPQVCAAMIGTVAFSLLFGVPRKYYPWCGVIGGAGWAVYVLASGRWGIVCSSFAATVVVIFLSRASAVINRCPVTIFLISGIFPLVPGAGIYWTVYYLVTDSWDWPCIPGMRRLRQRWPLYWGLWLCLNCLRGCLPG